MLPLVSVIIPVFNVKPYLNECINSVIKQTYKRLEIVIVDDGSTDGSEMICDSFQKKDERIITIHQVNQGLSAARNTGIDSSHGEIIAFLDSDDAYLPNMIENMVNAMKKTYADIVVCGFYFCRTTKHMAPSQYIKSFNPQKGVISSKTALKHIVEGKINVNVWNKLYRREVFNTLRFPVRHNFEDLLLTPFLFEQARRITIVDKQLVLYRNRKNSITSTIDKENISDWLYAINIWEAFIRDRIPSVYDLADYKCIKEANFKGLLGKKLTLLSNRHINADASIIEVEREIHHRSVYINEFSNKTKLYYFIVDLNPQLGVLIKKNFRFLKNLQEQLLAMITSKRSNYDKSHF